MFRERKLSKVKIAISVASLKKKCIVCGKLNQYHTRKEAIYCDKNWDKAIACDGSALTD